jgi:putative hemolysin
MKTTRAAKVLSVLVTGAFCAAVPTVAAAAPSTQETVQQGWVNLGGVSLRGYCRSEGYRDVALVSHDAYGWRCVSPGVDSVNMYQVCAWQYDRPDVWSAYHDFDDPYSWTCYTYYE